MPALCRLRAGSASALQTIRASRPIRSLVPAWDELAASRRTLARRLLHHEEAGVCGAGAGAGTRPIRSSARTAFGRSRSNTRVRVGRRLANTHAASSPSSPMRAVLLSAERATLAPKRPFSPRPAPPLNFAPRWAHVEPERVKIHAAPTRSRLPSLSIAAPITATLPLKLSARLSPKLARGPSPPPVSFSRRLQMVPARVKTHAAPCPESSPPAPIRAVVPLTREEP